MDWNWIDLLIVGVIVLSAIISLVRGLIPEVLSLATWIAAFAFALKFFPEAAPYFEQWLTSPMVRNAAGFVAVFLATLIIGAIIAFILGALVKATGLRPMDRFLGLFFGIARGAFVIALAVLAVGLTAIPQEPFWQESKLLPHFERGALWLRDRMPENVQDHFQYDANQRTAPPTQAPAEPDAPVVPPEDARSTADDSNPAAR